MPDSQSSEPVFESCFATVSKLGIFVLSIDAPVDSAVNEYMAIDSGGNVSDLVVARNCSFARMLERCRNEQVCQGRKKCEALWAVQRTGYSVIYKLPLPLLAWLLLLFCAILIWLSDIAIHFSSAISWFLSLSVIQNTRMRQSWNNKATN